MSWRFRKTFKVMPGVKLNLTRRGLSATVGASPFSVNVGPQGVYRNIAIPGTGIWSRERLDIPSPHSHHGDAAAQPAISPITAPPVPFAPPAIPLSAEIRSASTESLNSESMEQFRRLLTDAHNERSVIEGEISIATAEFNSARRRYTKWDSGFLMKRVRPQAFAVRKEVFETSRSKLEELQEQLRQTSLATEISIDREQGEPYYRMRDEFAALSGCQRIWSILTEQAVDRVKERSAASTALTRDTVPFSLASCDLIQWEQKVPHLANRTGGDMYIFPGFILFRSSKQAFALIDFRDVVLRFASSRFVETELIPSDSMTVGHTWTKVNKDGTPDKRFSGNRQMPIVHYGTLLFSSHHGLDVRYLCSNPALAERFAKSWVEMRQSLN